MVAMQRKEVIWMPFKTKFSMLKLKVFYNE